MSRPGHLDRKIINVTLPSPHLPSSPPHNSKQNSIKRSTNVRGNSAGIWPQQEAASRTTAEPGFFQLSPTFSPSFFFFLFCLFLSCQIFTPQQPPFDISTATSVFYICGCSCSSLLHRLTAFSPHSHSISTKSSPHLPSIPLRPQFRSCPKSSLVFLSLH